VDARSGAGDPRARRHEDPSGSLGSHKGEDRAPPRQRPERGDAYYGALDLGTNNCRLLIAAPSPTGFTVIDAFSRIVRLGEGLTGRGALSEPAMNARPLRLAIFRDKRRFDVR